MTRSEGRPEPAPVRIAVDLLGGDEAPAVVVDGALLASRADPDLRLMLVGPHRVADELLAALDPAERGRMETLVTEHGVGMAEPATRGGDPRTTIGAATRAVAAGNADALVSAGASGPTVAAAVMGLGRLPGVRRPALAAVLPGTGGPLVLLDVGAGMETTPRDLIQYAIIGAGYAHRAVGIAEPRIALLSVGSEPGKGDRLRRAVDAALRSHPLLDGARYVGLVEGDEVIAGSRADVVVTDGFTGNVVLKALEAVLGLVPDAYPPSAVPRAAALLGVAGTVVVCHGAADGAQFASGVQLAAHLVRIGLARRLAAAGDADPDAPGTGEPPAGDERQRIGNEFSAVVPRGGSGRSEEPS